MPRRFALKPASVAAIVGFIALTAAPSGCEKLRPPEVEVIANRPEGRAWFTGTPEEAQYLISQFTTDGVRTIDWPPPALRRRIDISIDVSGSGYEAKVLFEGRRLPLAEYNVRRFFSYLAASYPLKPGDRVRLRLFGAHPGGESIRVDESKHFQHPVLKIKIKSTIFTRRHDDRRLEAISIEHPVADRSAIPGMLAWSLARLSHAREPAETYKRSPLLNHIDQVVRSYDPANQRLFFFVTDGYFHAGDLYFSPEEFAEQRVTPENVKRYVVTNQLRPFRTDDNKVQIILYGLEYGNDETYRRERDKLLHWFLEPLGRDQILFVRGGVHE